MSIKKVYDKITTKTNYRPKTPKHQKIKRTFALVDETKL